MNRWQLTLCFAALGAWGLAFAPLLPEDDELCQKGDHEACERIALAAKIKKLGVFDSAKYSWQPDPKYLKYSVPSATKDRLARSAQVTCTNLNSVWINDDVARFALLNSTVLVDRAEYDKCYFMLLDAETSAENRRVAIRVAKYAGAFIGALLLFAAFWYRRPLMRGAQSVRAAVNRTGAK